MSASPNVSVSTSTSSRIHPLVAASSRRSDPRVRHRRRGDDRPLAASKAVSPTATSSPVIDTRRPSRAHARSRRTVPRKPRRARITLPSKAQRATCRAKRRCARRPRPLTIRPQDRSSPSTRFRAPSRRPVSARSAARSLAGWRARNRQGPREDRGDDHRRAGGGLAGNTIEHAVHKATTYQVQVRMTDGSYRNFTYQADPGVQVGQRVRVAGIRWWRLDLMGEGRTATMEGSRFDRNAKLGRSIRSGARLSDRRHRTGLLTLSSSQS